jgi:uncharacterized protein YdhG (YjbR/CyaY superfamily)
MGTLSKLTCVDEYLAALSDEKRTALEKLRRDIRTAVPTAEECIALQVPTFRLGRKMLVCFGAAEDYCALHAGAFPVAVHKDELVEYETNGGTVRFDPEAPLPSDLVRKLMRTRVSVLPNPRPIAPTSLARHRRRVSA